jgi:hypothetical protein
MAGSKNEPFICVLPFRDPCIGARPIVKRGDFSKLYVLSVETTSTHDAAKLRKPNVVTYFSEILVFLCHVCTDQSSSVHEIYTTRFEVVEQVAIQMPPNRAVPHRANVAWV